MQQLFTLIKICHRCCPLLKTLYITVSSSCLPLNSRSHGTNRPNLRMSSDRSFIQKTPMKKWLPEVAGTRTGWKRGFDFGSLGTRIVCLKYEKQELPLPIIVVIYDYIFSVSQSTISYNSDSFIYSVALSDVFCKC